jgi:hypothetical protein
MLLPIAGKRGAEKKAAKAETSGQRAGADAGIVEGPAVRAGRRRDVANAYPQGWSALPLLYQPKLMTQGANTRPVRQIPAGEIERIVIDQIRSLLQTPEVIIQTCRACHKADTSLAESNVRSAVLEFEPIWNELFPAEQARIVEMLVERIDLQPDGIDLCLRLGADIALQAHSGSAQQEAA